MKTYRIQYKYWTHFMNRTWKGRGQRTYKADSPLDATIQFQDDKTRKFLPSNAEVIKVWELVG